MAERILAIEISNDVIRAAVAERSWNSFVLTGTFEAKSAPDETDLNPALARLVAQTGNAEVVISAFPGELVAKRLLTLPFHDRRRLEQAVPFALEEHLPFAVDDAVVSYVTVGRENGGSRVLAAMARKDDLSAHLELLASAGLNPKIVTLSAVSLPALLARARNGHAAQHLLLDLDQRRISLILLSPDGVPSALRTITLAPEAANGHGDVDNVTARALAAVRQTLIAQSAEAEPPEVVLSGELGTTPEVQHQLSTELALKVRGSDSVDCSGLLEGLTPQRMRYASCISMLLGEAPRGAIPMLDLRRAEFVFRGNQSSLAPLYKPALVALAVALLAILHVTLSAVNQYGRLSVLNQQIARAASPALGPRPPENVKAALNSGIADMRKRLKLMGGSSQNSPLDILLAVSQSIPSTLTVDIDDMLIDEAGLKISGTADSFGTIDRLKKALGTNDTFGDIEVADAKAGSDPSKIEFHLTASLRDNPLEAN
ncbi:MAG TPA: type II secretion system protein GspL [Candidatus Binataceae bacterium]|nr:type II secretion system protein GspL [Candidatus Binataceae bacterium]